MIELDKIVSLDFDDYIKEEHSKTMIVLHHSAGWDNARGMFNGWQSNRERVATCCGIVDDGTIYQGFSSKYWAWHINVWSKGNQLPEYLKPLRKKPEFYEQHSIGVEVCNWGALQKRDGQFYTYVNGYGTRGKAVTVNPDKVVYYEGGFRGHRYYERYTDEEIQSLYNLIKFWSDRYNIPLNFSGPSFFDVSKEAISGLPNVYTHANFRTDKSDMHPQRELIQMLESL